MTGFIWDVRKEFVNVHKHGVDFAAAAKAFLDPDRKIYKDSRHGEKEERFLCVGKVRGRILTVRFVYRSDKVRIFGAGHWRKGKRYYEKKDE